MSSLTYDRDGFTLDGQPLRILAGALHYFRVHPEQWDGRLALLRAMGLNTVETYVAWNLHEPRPGAYDFSGMLDLERFVRTAERHGLKVLLRPGPYICAEWEFGALPAWLLKDRSMRLRCADPAFLAAVDRWFDVLLPRIVPLLAEQGGPVLALQVENEYGSYGNDAAYLRHLADGLRRRGAHCLLFTSDGPSGVELQGGTLPDALPTVNFGDRVAENLAVLRGQLPDGPLVCMEYWNGWFDNWGAPHHTRDAADAARVLEELLAAGASVNLYLAHGGTNFGYLNGANLEEDGRLKPTVTSYDYDAAIDEAGRPTAKFWAFREVLGRYTELPPMPRDAPPPLEPRTLELGPPVPLLDLVEQLTTPVPSAAPLSMEELDQSYGFVLYRTWVSGPRESAELLVDGLGDRAQVFLDGRPAGVLDRTAQPGTARVEFAVPASGVRLELLVENLGRVNYGPRPADRKGIAEGVRLGRQLLLGWQMFPLPLVHPVPPAAGPGHGAQGASGAGDLTDRPVLRRAVLEVDRPADTFVLTEGHGKGLCWINGFLLGRYWDIGPQQTLYLPGPLLRPGRNELVLLELHGPRGDELALVAEPVLDRLAEQHAQA
ncbi:beta-galactosidase [Kitasatospora sp. NBC_01287]|uniref:glycoside hydrolase family 35 protein n=1 Tax=Kitasatospora sp. NBC_01287 TaxID=2903573 RepID=UPI00225593DB|nr:beta-galactosidase family protein [Kitasatospora sp. NBC_01287]MCX4748249.1 beta-galactosidase [Kitasatospora sp. NBC_01287]